MDNIFALDLIGIIHYNYASFAILTIRRPKAMKECPECRRVFDRGNYCTTCAVKLRESTPTVTHQTPAQHSPRNNERNLLWTALFIALVVIGILAYPKLQEHIKMNADSVPVHRGLDGSESISRLDRSITTDNKRVKESNTHRDATEILMTKTPYYHEHFSVEYNRQEKNFTVTLYAILNHSWQIEQYQADLKQYKQEALAWIVCQGVNPASIEIKYVPEEAGDQPAEHHINQFIVPPESSPESHASSPSINPVPGQWSGIMTTAKGTTYDLNLSLDYIAQDGNQKKVTGRLHQYNTKTGTQADEIISGTIDLDTGKIILLGEDFEPAWPEGWFLDKLECSIAENGKMTANFYRKSDNQYLGSAVATHIK